MYKAAVSIRTRLGLYALVLARPGRGASVGGARSAAARSPVKPRTCCFVQRPAGPMRGRPTRDAVGVRAGPRTRQGVSEPVRGISPPRAEDVAASGERPVGRHSPSRASGRTPARQVPARPNARSRALCSAGAAEAGRSRPTGDHAGQRGHDGPEPPGAHGANAGGRLDRGVRTRRQGEPEASGRGGSGHGERIAAWHEVPLLLPRPDVARSCPPGPAPAVRRTQAMRAAADAAGAAEVPRVRQAAARPRAGPARAEPATGP